MMLIKIPPVLRLRQGYAAHVACPVVASGYAGHGRAKNFVPVRHSSQERRRMASPLSTMTSHVNQKRRLPEVVPVRHNFM
jgi:hypothetical protein